MKQIAKYEITIETAEPIEEHESIRRHAVDILEHTSERLSTYWGEVTTISVRQVE